MADQSVGRTFGRVADLYERARPEYPPEAVDRAARELGLDAGSTVLDLAAGTGKLTTLLTARFGRVIAVEPDDEMRGRLTGDARPGTAEEIPVADSEVDAVFVGDAFHWFDAPAALAEMGRVLRPGGGLALLWNDWWNRERPPLPDEARALLDELFARFHSDGGAATRDWRSAVENSFGMLGHAEFVSELPYEGGRLAELCVTTSSPAALGDEERSLLQQRLTTLLPDDRILTVVTNLYWGKLP